MTDAASTPPIVVNASPVPAQTIAGVRQVILMLAGFATALGVFHVAALAHLPEFFNSLALFSGPIAGGATFIMGQFHTRHAAERLAVMADHLPDQIASTK